MAGWIKLHRDLSEHWLWECEVFSKGQAWVDLIMFAHFSEEPKKIIIKGKLYTLSRGQQARSELTLAKKWKWSRNKVRRFLKKLENDLMLEQHSDNKTSIISITNFDKYQRRETPGDTPNDTASDTPTGHQPDTTRDTIEECKKEENGKLKEKEEVNFDNLQHTHFGFNGDPVFLHSYKSIKLGYRENNSTVSAAGNRESDEVFYGGNGNAGDRVDPRPGDGVNLNWSDLDDGYIFRGNGNNASDRFCGNSCRANNNDCQVGEGVSDGRNNANIYPGFDSLSLGGSGFINGLDGSKAVGKESAQVDREEEVVNDNTGSNHADRRGDIRDGGRDLPDTGGGDILEQKAEDPPKPPPKAKEKNGIPYKAIVEILNEHTGKNFRHTTKQTQSLIKARWRDGYTIDDFRRVIAGRVEKWIGDPKMCEYLRPPTLFGSKFESYLQAESTVKKITLPKTNNKINCKECSNIGSCRNAEDKPIASCALYTPQSGLVATSHTNEGNNAKAKTVSQMMILENDAIAKALLEDRRQREAMGDGEG